MVDDVRNAGESVPLGAPPNVFSISSILSLQLSTTCSNDRFCISRFCSSFWIL